MIYHATCKTSNFKRFCVICELLSCTTSLYMRFVFIRFEFIVWVGGWVGWGGEGGHATGNFFLSN